MPREDIAYKIIIKFSSKKYYEIGPSMLSGVMLSGIMLNVTVSFSKQVFTKCLTNILKNILTTRRPYKLTLDFKKYL